MSNPYFSVGEEVILVSVDYPELNGDYIILDVMPPTGNIIRGRDGLMYRHNNLDYSIGEGGRNGLDHWAQSALRKKHKPSTDSFTEMMSNINELVTQ